MVCPCDDGRSATFVNNNISLHSRELSTTKTVQYHCGHSCRSKHESSHCRSWCGTRCTARPTRGDVSGYQARLTCCRLMSHHTIYLFGPALVAGGTGPKNILNNKAINATRVQRHLKHITRVRLLHYTRLIVCSSTKVVCLVQPAGTP